MRRTILVGICGLMMACGGQESATPPTLATDIKAADGTALAASYYSSDKPGPGILLFHQCNMDRHAWDTLANDLKSAGFHVLAADRRGFGDSGGTATNDNADIDAVFQDLISRPGVDRERIAAGGASCGVDDALDIAMRHEQVRSLVLLSGYADEGQRKFVAGTPALAVFGAVSKYDMARDIEDVVKASANPRSVVKVYPGSWLGMIVTSMDHGVSMFGHNPDLRPAIVHWLQQQLMSR